MRHCFEKEKVHTFPGLGRSFKTGNHTSAYDMELSTKPSDQKGQTGLSGYHRITRVVDLNSKVVMCQIGKSDVKLRIEP